jgi:glycosyltransferase involved in cell wall biosynthesis
MRIIQLIQKPQLRGAEMFASQLSEQLLALGHECKIVTLFAGQATLPFSGEFIHLNQPLNKRLWDWAGWKNLAALVEKENPDVIQANAGDTLKFAVLSKLFFRWKTPIVFRNANKVSDFINSWPKLIFNKFLMSRVSHVISVSELCRQDFTSTYSFLPVKTTTVPIGIELQSVSPLLQDDVKAIFSTGNVLVHVGSFVPEKNHTGLIRVVERLLEKGVDIKLVLLGDGKLRSMIEQHIREKKLTDRIFLLGYRSDVLSIMTNAQALVMPSIIEGLPGVILEAMYCRTSVIAYNVGGISEVVKSGETGWLVKAGDEEGFVAAIEEVLHTSDLKLIRENAFKMVVTEYDNRVIAKRFLEVYERVLSL